MAIGHALTVLSYYELPDDERPPEHIWLDDEALSAHFDALRDKRTSGISGGEPVPQADLEQNTFTKELLGR